MAQSDTYAAQLVHECCYMQGGLQGPLQLDLIQCLATSLPGIRESNTSQNVTATHYRRKHAVSDASLAAARELNNSSRRFHHLWVEQMHARLPAGDYT